MFRTFTLSPKLMSQSVSPSHAGWTGTTSGFPSAPTVAMWAHDDSREASALMVSRSAIPR